MTKKNGYWYLILMVRDETGRLKQKWISTHLRVEGNKKKAEAMLLAARREYTDLAEIQKRSNDILVSHYLTTWVEGCRGKVSIGTYEEYKNCINNRIVPYFEERNILLLDLKPADVLDYYNSLYAKGLTGNTVLHYHVLLRRALKEASMRGLIQNDPTDVIPRPKKGQSVADCYSPEECRKLLDALHGDPLELPITLAVLYGLRRSEVLGLRWSAIDFKRATIMISHSVTSSVINGKRQMIAKDKLKRKSSFRTLPLMPQVAAMLQKVAIQRYGIQPPPNGDYICVNGVGQLLTPDYLSEHFKTILAKNNLRRIRFHDLRHSCANLLISARVPLIEVQQWLGHSSLSTTADLYVHLEYAAKEQNAHVISQMLL
ncbi:tyrosine-type recombinase/integrase [Brotocaccenecus cirricatena]|nr:site-specific integrase [Brotocaccenecus cirricatena]